jgi:hypothetical protein
MIIFVFFNFLAFWPFLLIKSPKLIVFAPFLIIIITSPQLLSGDVLLFYVSFSLLFLLCLGDLISRWTDAY